MIQIPPIELSYLSFYLKSLDAVLIQEKLFFEVDADASSRLRVSTDRPWPLGGQF